MAWSEILTDCLHLTSQECHHHHHLFICHKVIIYTNKNFDWVRRRPKTTRLIVEIT